MRLVLIPILMCVAPGIADAGTASVAVADMTSWTIVCSRAATACEQHAAIEFQTLFQGMTGKVLPISDKAPDGQGAISIGPEAVAMSAAPAPTDELGEEGCRIHVGNNAVRIDGGRPRGTLYGVYEFFEVFCGVRYLTHDHTHYPENALSRRIPCQEHTHKPLFAFRWSYYGETNRYPEFAARLRTNTVGDDPKLGGRTGYRLVSHNVAYLVPPAKYGQEHPEYYALVDGQRKLDVHGGGPQLCMTNHEVLGIVVDAVRDAIKSDPSARNINIAQMDNECYCTCAACAAIDAREGSHAGATLAFVNAVAEQIEKSHPDALISTYAYQYTRKPPKTVRARRNVMIQLCSIECCDLHAIDDPSCAKNRAFCADMAGWRQKADHIFIWHYNTNFRAYLLPFPNLRSIGKSVAFFAQNNGRGVFMQAAGNGFSTELSDLRNYVMSRCLWQPGRDSWQEAEEFCRLHYREAAGPILEYLKYYHDLVAAAGVHPGCFPTESELCIDPKTVPQINAYFQQALAAARSEAVRARVEKASLCATRAALSAASMRLTCKDGVCRPQLEGREPDHLAHYSALCDRYGVSMDNEQTPVATYIADMRKLYAGMKAVQLENAIWRLVLLPDSNAKIVEMTHKPSGRNVIEPARALDRFRYEEWVRQGAGPTAQNVMPYEVQAEKDRVLLTVTAQDGATIARNILLAGDAIRFETVMTAASARIFECSVHPEYATGTRSHDPDALGIYVKKPHWVHANKGWRDAQPTEQQTDVFRDSIAGGVCAYYNQRAGFGVEQRFDPAEFSSMTLFWSPARQQVNLELFSRIAPLEKGQQARYAYEVRYLAKPPMGAADSDTTSRLD